MRSGADGFEKCVGVRAGDALSLSIFLRSLPVQVAAGVCDRVMAIVTPHLGAAQHRGLELRLPTPSLPPPFGKQSGGCAGYFSCPSQDGQGTSALGIAWGRLSTIQ